MECGDGCFFGAYIEGEKDGFIKLTPGGVKPRARSKRSNLVSRKNFFFKHSFFLFQIISSFFSEILRHSRQDSSKFRG
jgi:hypothetical protein